MSQRCDSIEKLSHTSNQSKTLKNQQLRQRIAELEMETLKWKRRLSEQLSEKKITKAEAARLLKEFSEMKPSYADKPSDLTISQLSQAKDTCLQIELRDIHLQIKNQSHSTK